MSRLPPGGRVGRVSCTRAVQFGLAFIAQAAGLAYMGDGLWVTDDPKAEHAPLKLWRMLDHLRSMGAYTIRDSYTRFLFTGKLGDVAYQGRAEIVFGPTEHLKLYVDFN